VTTPIARTILIICGLAIVGSLAVNLATGSYYFSRHTDEELAKANRADELDSLFEETGAGEGLEEFEEVETTYALGWLPSGPPPSIDFLSVATIAGPAVVLGAVAFWFSRRGGSHRRIAADSNDAQENTA